jgi:CheY-like chemotaxis protein
MPAMDGVQLAQIIRPLYPTIPIILLSSIGDERVRIYSELFSSVLTKPVKESLLCTSILAEFKMHNKIALQGRSVKSLLTPEFSKQSPMNILIAEDNIVNQKLTDRVLRKLGYHSDIASNGLEVLRMMKQKIYDLILMDVQMPEMDGLEATRQIRKQEGNQPVIIAMTANAMQGDREECLKAGMNDYISKPVNFEILLNTLEKFSTTLKFSNRIP